MLSTVDGSRVRWLFGPPGWKNALRETVIYLITLPAVVFPLSQPGPLGPIGGLALGVSCLLARRRWPAFAFAASGVMSGVFMVVLAFSAGRRLSQPVWLGASVLGAVASGVLAKVLVGVTASDHQVAVIGGGAALITASLPAILGYAVARRRTLLEVLRERAFHLERERRSLVSEARTRERARIAMDMHDSLGHQLTLISLQAGGLKVTAAEPEQARTASELHEAARRAMVELREIVGVLGREAGQDAPPHGSPLDRLPVLLNSARATGTAVDYAENGTAIALPRATESAIHRIVQEGLTNVARHAPGAPVAVRVNYEPDGVIVEVVNGVATALPHKDLGGGRGLSGLRERARLAGGVLHAAPTPDGGFRLAGVLPYDATPSPEPADELDGYVPENPLALNETGTVMRRLRDRPVLLGSALVGVVVVGLVAVFVSIYLFSAHLKLSISEAEYEAARVGQSEHDVVAALPPVLSTVQKVFAGSVEPEPVNARCDYHLASTAKLDGSTTTYYRFCFRDGVLHEKRRFVVKDSF
ncbi:sensor histidine kinase [Allokutzneria multivorans]|uniref:sensor histidine kinase n=1 Tax=Allokutzneria multivorans TaxID=1142134 RepID=UPI0031F0EA5F